MFPKIDDSGLGGGGGGKIGMSPGKRAKSHFFQVSLKIVMM